MLERSGDGDRSDVMKRLARFVPARFAPLGSVPFRLARPRLVLPALLIAAASMAFLYLRATQSLLFDDCQDFFTRSKRE